MSLSEAKEKILSIKGLLELGISSEDIFTSLKKISEEFGEDFVLDLFEDDNESYNLFYYYLARSGLKIVAPQLENMIKNPVSVEKENEKDPYYGALGFLFLNDSSGNDFLKKFLNREIKELHYQSNDEFIDDLIVKKTKESVSFAEFILNDDSVVISEESKRKLILFIK